MCRKLILKSGVPWCHGALHFSMTNDGGKDDTGPGILVSALIAGARFGESLADSSEDEVLTTEQVLKVHNKRRTEKNFKGSVVNISFASSKVSNRGTLLGNMTALVNAGMHMVTAFGNF
ncbi:hypothetical protein ABW20_dc0106700 [Dactylellina cionopaga]|nr:hypothetical protein ABW20_dc0106700 [Dactylellina cionopaga]